jgi:cytochrome c oxidase subunit IV
MAHSELDSGQGETTHQEHPLGIYFKIWLLLFFLSACSYMVDYLNFQGMLRWSLIIVFMLLKAGLILAIFMHMIWERMALVTAIILPPFVLVLLLGFMGFEADYTNGTRVDYMGEENIAPFSYHHEAVHAESAIENNPAAAH